MPGRPCTRPISVPITRSTTPPKCGRPGGRHSMAMPCWAQPRSNAWEWKSDPLSTPSRRGLPCTGQLAFTSRIASHGALSIATCVRQRPTEVADGASRVTWKPAMQRLYVSMATVSHGRPIGSRSIGSTTIRSIGVWSTCTRSSGCRPCGAWPCTGFASGCSSPRRRRSARGSALRRRRIGTG